MLGLEAAVDDFHLDPLELGPGSRFTPAVFAGLIGRELDPAPDLDLGPARVPTPVGLGRPRSWLRAALVGLAIAGMAVTAAIASRMVSDYRLGMAADQYLEAADDVAVVIPRLSHAATQLADFSQRNLEEVTGILNLAAQQITRLQRTVAGPAPATLPFADGAGRIDLMLSADRLLGASDRIQAANQRLAIAATYRAVFATAFQLPHLPDAIDPVEVPALQRDLAVAVTKTQQAIANLPDDALFQPHRSAAEAQLEALRSWQADYLEALHRSDLVSAQQLRTELEGEMDKLEAGLSKPLGLLVAEVAAELAELGAQLEAEMGVLGA